ncbi:MAG: Lrp/AsnC family transcriptional regulator [Rhodospirillales bacterium]
MARSGVEERLLNDYQRSFPLEPRPFARIAAELGIGEDALLELVADLQAQGVVGRVGAVVRPNAVGASTLAAVAAPADRLAAVATALSARAEINHCYEREHAINLWFVVTAGCEADVVRVLREIEAETGLAVLDLPLLEGYHIDLGFDLRCG